MHTQKLFRSIVAVLAIAMGGCGGGTGGTGSSVPSGTTGVSAGAITDFGSIWVNGVEFSTTATTILRDDVSVNENELRRGMVVEVRGSIDSSTSGVADTVVVEEAVRGPVESVSGTIAAGTLVVLGQTVRVDGTTLIDNNVPNFASIVGTLLEVHGHRRSDGSIGATFIESKTAPITYAVRGAVAAHNAANQSFTIGALTVNYAGAIIGDMPTPSGANWNNMFVEVKGLTCGALPVCGTLTASKVEPEGLGTTAAARAEVEGFVTNLVSTSDFTVGTQRVVTTGATIFAGGLQDEILVGVKLEAEGTLAGGILTATKVSFRDSIRLEGNIASIIGTDSLTLSGLPGVVISVNAFTDINGNGNLGNGDFVVGNHVRIRGRATGVATVMASELEARSADTRVILQATVSAVSNPSLTLLGVSVNTTSINDINFRNIDDSYLGSTAFFNALATPNRLVKVRGTLAAGVITWNEIELED